MKPPWAALVCSVVFRKCARVPVFASDKPRLFSLKGFQIPQCVEICEPGRILEWNRIIVTPRTDWLDALSGYDDAELRWINVASQGLSKPEKTFEVQLDEL
jgi:hypothetical protein